MPHIPSAKDLMATIAKEESEKASAAMKAHAAAAAEKEAMLDKMRRPSGMSDDEVVAKASIIVNRAVANGHTSVEILRFPHALCSDNGRAINQGEAGWENTLTGVPREIFDFWQRQLKSRGYHLRYEVVDYPGGMPGDIGVTLSWG